MNIERKLLSDAKEEEKYRDQYIVAADLRSTTATAFFSTIPIHASPLSVNLVSNAILRTMAPGKKYEIQVANHPLQNGLKSSLEASKPNPDFSSEVPILFGIFLTVGLSLFAASYIVFPVEEKLCKVRPRNLKKLLTLPNTYSRVGNTN